MKRLQILWLSWKLQTALDELRTFQARFDVGPLYLVNVMRHVAHLEDQIAALRAPRPSLSFNFKART
jgi:hypothetical protein